MDAYTAQSRFEVFVKHSAANLAHLRFASGTDGVTAQIPLPKNSICPVQLRVKAFDAMSQIKDVPLTMQSPFIYRDRAHKANQRH